MSPPARCAHSQTRIGQPRSNQQRTHAADTACHRGSVWVRGVHVSVCLGVCDRACGSAAVRAHARPLAQKWVWVGRSANFRADRCCRWSAVACPSVPWRTRFKASRAAWIGRRRSSWYRLRGRSRRRELRRSAPALSPAPGPAPACVGACMDTATSVYNNVCMHSMHNSRMCM